MTAFGPKDDMHMKRKRKVDAERASAKPRWADKRNLIPVLIFVAILVLMFIMAMGGHIGTGAGVSRGATY
ncbi:hypothetical protein BST95_03610 [Halioglobus japonicus]|uniref:Uncharacterized protein n=1 Tax=Halioglobus japonicus TaxID=930805 RepID=A0AAP8SMU3_9GAMM|nr:hypothetical protein BST95_03610 [Halioglobus japonicus]PLW85383.1 hypothetical protein C0029_12175 [Halioglobus japonicus]GHD15394.1 hypothetical protein GCM10007052_19500 [Halioglobus japonicus]